MVRFNPIYEYLNKIEGLFENVEQISLGGYLKKGLPYFRSPAERKRAGGGSYVSRGRDRQLLEKLSEVFWHGAACRSQNLIAFYLL